MEKTFINNEYPAIFGIKNTPANLALSRLNQIFFFIY